LEADLFIIAAFVSFFVFGVVQLASSFFKLASCSQAHKTHIIQGLNGLKLRVKWFTILVQRSFLLHARKLTKT
jgi:hypothetical protein